MAKPKLKQFSFIFCLMFALLASPVVSAACTCAALHNQDAREHLSDENSIEHCSAQLSRENNDHSDDQTKPEEKSGKIQTVSSYCGCCLKNLPSRVAAKEQKFQQTTDVYPAVLPPPAALLIVWQLKSASFYTPDIAYQARSDLADKPARAPPVL